MPTSGQRRFSPTNKSEEGMNQRYATWTRQRRLKEAAERVVHEEWSQVKAAQEYGVSRQRLNGHVKELRSSVDAAKDRATEALAQNRAEDTGIYIGKERRRVPSFEDFDRMYWGNWICPDCGIHHETPAFHAEMTEALLNSDPRTLMNIPPYHAKSTLATVKHSVYRLVTNPNSRTIIVSKSASFAATFLHSIAQLLTNPELYEGSERNLIHDFGPFQEPGGVWNAKNIYIAGRVTAEKDPTILTLGVEEQIYGRRADYIVFDDCATLENQRNPERVQKMLEWMDKEALSRIGKRGKAVWVGTRVHAGDIYSRLMHREGYRVIRYSCIQDDAEELTLWPEHFPYSQAQVHRAEMNPADFQLVYQNVDLPGVGASFPPEVVEACKDPDRVMGQTAPGWRFVGGLDPAGGGKKSGFTSITVLAVDLRTGQRYLVDQQNHRSFKAPQTKDLILKWSEAYPISEWRVEVNGLQGQIYQYDEELVRALALRGIRLQPHITHGKNKWDPQFGVESMAPLFHAGLFSIPWGNRQSQEGFRALCEQLISFPMGEVSDAVMSLWFAELGCRDLLRRQHMPLFNERQKVPKHVARRRHVVDFGNREVRNLELEQQRPGAQMGGLGPSRYRRQTVGVPTPNSEVDDSPPAFPEPARFVNVAGTPSGVAISD
jgi:hypothetical protein